MITCFFDASKAFDKVNHWNVSKKLIRRGVPAIIIKLLVFWYSRQTICVKWGSLTSQSFTVTNGVRQGSIISPHVFAVYVDDLSSSLIKSSHECRINDVVINHLFYVDDLCLMAPSPAALQVFINICSQFSEDNCSGSRRGGGTAENDSWSQLNHLFNNIGSCLSHTTDTA